MPYHHVIAKVGTEEKFRVLFADLTAQELVDLCVRPYEKGNPFFSGKDLISPNDVRSIQIIRTKRKSEIERNEINRQDRESIDRLNNSESGVFFISPGGGYEPQDIAEAGEDVTHAFIKGHPGYKARSWDSSKRIMGWISTIVAAVIAAGIVKWLGWL